MREPRLADREIVVLMVYRWNVNFMHRRTPVLSWGILTSVTTPSTRSCILLVLYATISRSQYKWLVHFLSQGHRVLLFSQTRQMLTIIESFVKSMNWSYRRLDGNTPVGMRQVS